MVIFDRMPMLDRFIFNENLKKGLNEPFLSEKECLNIFNISSNNYSAWKKQQEARKQNGDQPLDEAQVAWKEEQGRLLGFVRELGYIPGSRTLQLMYIRKYGQISRKRIRKLMRSLKLVAYRRKKDAYKHQATHNHPFAVPAGNLVNREFYLGPRRVVCTDITYLYYGPNRTPFYCCCFKDPSTEEILGWSGGTRMDVELVKSAYGMMMEKHGNELRKASCLIHSDQGTQFLAISFRELLSNDGFVQSISRRGDSLDNSPMESFFGLTKGILLDTIAMCRNATQAGRMLDGYFDMYNNRRPQYDLAGLTPSEYYDYVTTGIYPLEQYFGVDASELRTIKSLREDKGRFAAEEARKRREQYANKKIEAAKAAPIGMTDPRERVEKDLARVRKLMRTNNTERETCENQAYQYESVYWLITIAKEFIEAASQEVVADLANASHWVNYPELSYIYEMDGMF